MFLVGKLGRFALGLVPTMWYPDLMFGRIINTKTILSINDSLNERAMREAASLLGASRQIDGP